MADDNNDRDNDKDSNDGIGFDGRSVGARAAGRAARGKPGGRLLGPINDAGAIGEIGAENPEAALKGAQQVDPENENNRNKELDQIFKENPDLPIQSDRDRLRREAEETKELSWPERFINWATDLMTDEAEAAELDGTGDDSDDSDRWGDDPHGPHPESRSDRWGGDPHGPHPASRGDGSSSSSSSSSTMGNNNGGRSGPSSRGGRGGSAQSGGNEGATRGGREGDGTRGDGNGGGGGGGTKPIILDLDGDGVELVPLDESSVFYDINGDGYKYNLGWASADDGLLVYDKDDDGDIITAEEISFTGYVYGRMDEETALATYDANNDGILTDLEALAYFDDNNDGVLNDQDAEFAKFKVWQDLDQDGEVDDGELRTLPEANILEVNLSYNADDDGESEVVDGNTIYGVSSYQYLDDAGGVQSGDVGDVAFAVNSRVGTRINEEGHYEYRVDGEQTYIVYSGEQETENLTIDFSADAYVNHIGAYGGGW